MRSQTRHGLRCGKSVVPVRGNNGVRGGGDSALFVSAVKLAIDIKEKGAPSCLAIFDGRGSQLEAGLGAFRSGQDPIAIAIAGAAARGKFGVNQACGVGRTSFFGSWPEFF
jgi:hypothetical protein